MYGSIGYTYPPSIQRLDEIRHTFLYVDREGKLMLEGRIDLTGSQHGEDSTLDYLSPIEFELKFMSKEIEEMAA